MFDAPQTSSLRNLQHFVDTAPLETQPIAQDIHAAHAQSIEAQRNRHPHRPVREIMTADVVTFAEDTPIEEATRVMLQRRISGAPVADNLGRPIGIVSKTDLLEAWHENNKQAAAAQAELEQDATAAAVPTEAQQIAGEAGLGGKAAASGVVVGDIMVPYLLAAQDSSPISLAAALMAYEGVHRLLVLDEQHKMVGIVSTLDVLRWLAQLSGFCVARSAPPPPPAERAVSA